MGPAARPLTLLLLWAACAHAVIVPRALDGRGGPRAPLSAARLSRRRALSGAVGAGLSLCALAAAAPAVAAGGAAAGEVATGTAAAGAGANATVGLNAARTGATAAVARSAVRLATYPLDTIKTRQQTLDTTKTQPPAPQTAVQKERWTFDPSLFDGVGWALISAAPAGALLIGTFDTLRAAGLPSLVCSVAAAVPPLAFKVPLERLKQRMQVKRDALRDGDKPSPQSSFDVRRRRFSGGGRADAAHRRRQDEDDDARRAGRRGNAAPRPRLCQGPRPPPRRRRAGARHRAARDARRVGRRRVFRRQSHELTSGPRAYHMYMKRPLASKSSSEPASRRRAGLSAVPQCAAGAPAPARTRFVVGVESLNHHGKGCTSAGKGPPRRASSISEPISREAPRQKIGLPEDARPTLPGHVSTAANGGRPCSTTTATVPPLRMPGNYNCNQVGVRGSSDQGARPVVSRGRLAPSRRARR
ncbi:hypothetical protein M885DRAFT_24529 [Pelagophyceae sp. CCMP2097]|nr:hypothetical protein M885DRAFT_24529 [Pelagophyceae sp. CCMP2097]